MLRTTGQYALISIVLITSIIAILQLAFKVPEDSLGGHAFHTYRLTSPDDRCQMFFCYYSRVVIVLYGLFTCIFNAAMIISAD